MYKSLPFVFVKKCTKVYNFSCKKRMYKNVYFFLETIYIVYKMYKMYNVVTLQFYQPTLSSMGVIEI